MAVDAGTGVPSAARLLRAIHAHRDDIGFGEVQIRHQVEPETGVGIGMNAELLAIQKHGSVGRHSVEFNADLFAFPTRWSRKSPAIPADTGGEVATTRAGCILLARCLLNTPVMRQVDGAPTGVLKRLRGSIGGVAQEELPTVICPEHLSRRRGLRCPY